MPAYNAELTIAQTYSEIPFDIVDHVIVVDDASRDDTEKVTKELGFETVLQWSNNET